MHVDILGRELAVGNFVTNEYSVYRIVKFTPKMVSITPARSTADKQKLIHKYSRELTLVPDADVLIWLLKQPTKK